MDFAFNQPLFEIGEKSEYNIFISGDYKDINASMEYGYNGDDTYFNYETEATYKWKYFLLKSSKMLIEDKINRISLKGAFRYKIEQKVINLFLFKFMSDGYWNIGVRQTWDYKIPSTYFVIGKEYTKEINFLLTPAKLVHSMGFATKDFKKWKKQSKLKLNVSILSNFDIFILNQIIDGFMRNRFGVGLKF